MERKGSSINYSSKFSAKRTAIVQVSQRWVLIVFPDVSMCVHPWNIFLKWQIRCCNKAGVGGFMDTFLPHVSNTTFRWATGAKDAVQALTLSLANGPDVLVRAANDIVCHLKGVSRQRISYAGRSNLKVVGKDTCYDAWSLHVGMLRTVLSFFNYKARCCI